jgi:multicomponent Na+:H+ antiporter subunit D
MEAREAVFVLVLLTSSMLNVAYFFPIIYNAFFKKEAGARPAARADASWWMLAPILICALMSVILGLHPNAFIRFHEIALTVVANIRGL